MATRKKEKSNFKIYALVDGKVVFIGKTKGEISPVYYQHRRAQNPFTASYFYPKNSKNPDIHILETICCNSSESYRHIVAWVRIFQEAGYRVINPRGTLDDARDLFPKTLSLVDSLRPSSLDVVLDQTRYCKQNKTELRAVPTMQNEEKASKKPTKEKITLWASSEDKERFVEYAKSLGMTQSQTLQCLMEKTRLEKEDSLFPNWDSGIFVRNLREAHAREEHLLKERIHELETRLRLISDEKSAVAAKMEKSHLIVQKAVKDFYEYFDSACPIPLDIERARYKQYKKSLPKELNYEYPRCSGSTLIRYQALLVGEGMAPAQFVLGIDSHNNPIKLRFYPSKYFVGVKPGEERFAQRNSVWYMAWKMAGEVAELIAAFPLQIRPKYKNPMDEHELFGIMIDKLVAESDAFQ